MNHPGYLSPDVLQLMKDTDRYSEYHSLPNPPPLSERMGLVDTGIFPDNKEQEVLTNGHEWKVITRESGSTYATSVPLDEVLFEALIMKQNRPEEPLYLIHNHPRARNLIHREVGESDMSYLTRIKEREDLSTLPSGRKMTKTATSFTTGEEGDMRHWQETHNVFGGGIFNNDDLKIRIWYDGAETNKQGNSKLALEYDTVRHFDDNYNLVTEKQLVNIRWAAPDEDEPNTQYIDPVNDPNWDDKYNTIRDQISTFVTRDPSIR